MPYKFFSLLLALSFLSLNLSAQNYIGKSKDINKILENIKSFSDHYKKGAYQQLAECYTPDGKIFPNNAGIIEGTEAIKQRWTLPDGFKILEHKVSPSEIRIIKKYAYDYGIYEGETLKPNGDRTTWKGKYVIVWKKTGKDWKIYLDIWNRIED